jgi:hypothetical protein
MKYILIGLMLLSGCEAPAMAYPGLNKGQLDRLANAICRAENSKSWPYGIKHHYKHTTPRQACINTILHRERLWDGKGDFITYLGMTYSPPSINPNWVRLVHYFYDKGV